MKRRLVSAISLCMVLCVMMSFAACGEQKTVSTDDDFFKDSVNTISGNQAQDDEQDISSGNNESVGGGKTWEQVLESMPNDLRGTSITVYNWNPISEYTGGTSIIK